MKETVKFKSPLIRTVIALTISFLTCFAYFDGGSLRAADSSRSAGGIVAMISVDGLAAYYLDDPKAEMPTIRALAAVGARASIMKASPPTVTWPNHTTMEIGRA